MSGDTASYARAPRDPRVDKAISWALGTAATLALAVGGWQIRSLGEKVDAVAAQIASLQRTVAVLEAGGLEARVRGLEERLTRVEASGGAARIPPERPRSPLYR